MKPIYLFLALAGAMCLTACGGSQAQFNIQLLHTDCVNGRLDFFGTAQPADGFSVSITGDGIGNPITKDIAAAPGQDLPLVPYGTNRVVTVLARRGTASVAYGSSTPFELKKGVTDFTVQVLMYPMWQFAHVGDDNGECPGLQPRAAAAATLLKDGRVLIAGGYTGKVGPSTFGLKDLTPSTQFFDPRSGEITNGPDMCTGAAGECTGRGFDTALTLDDGRVMMAGGYNIHQPRKKDAVDPIIFDPAKNTWTAAKLTTARREFVPVLLQPDKNGKRKVVVISGRPTSPSPLLGDDTDPPLTTYEIFDPSTNQWTQANLDASFPGVSGYRVGELALSGIDSLGRTLSQGFAIVSGYGPPAAGTPPTPVVNDTVYGVNRTDGTLLGATTKLSPAVLDPAVVGLNKGVLILGGFSADDQTVSNKWYHWSGLATTFTGTVNNGEADSCTVVLDQYRSLIVGGQPIRDQPQGDDQALMATEPLLATTPAVGPAQIPGTTESAQLREKRQAMSCLRLNDHQVLILAGYGLTTGGNSTLGSMEIYTFDNAPAAN